MIARESIILVYFQAQWCPHCRDLTSEVESAVQELEEIGIAVGKVDASEHRALAADAGVRGVPWFKIYFNGEGKKSTISSNSTLALLMPDTGTNYEGPRDAVGLVARVREEAMSQGIELIAPVKPKCGSLEATQDRGGNGGHGGSCTSKGQISIGLCKQKLVDSSECSALTYKNGECYLHDRRMPDHWSDKVPGAMYVVKQVKGIDRCV